MENHTERVREACLRLYLARKKKKEAEEELKEVEKREGKEISNYMYCNGMKSIEVLLSGGQGCERLAMNPVLLRLTKSKSKKVTFDVDKLKVRLPKKLQKKVLNKRYEISDFEGLKEYLKSCGVDPKIFKGFIRVVETVDYDSMNQLYDLGEVDLKRLEGCYDVKESKESILLYDLKKKKQ